MGYLFLTIAIIEVAGTAALKASAEFTNRSRPRSRWPATRCIRLPGPDVAHHPGRYRLCHLGRLRIVLVALVSFALFGQKLDAPALVGVGLITAGVVEVNVFSGSVAQ